MAEFKDRLNQALRYKDMKASELSRLTGIGEGAISQYRKGAYKASQEKLELLAKALNVPIAWLMGAEVSTKPFFDIFSIPGIEPLPEMEKKPLLGTIACGEPIFAEENIEDYIPVPQSNHCDFLLRCKGNSMIGARVHDGDLVCIRQQPTVENGEIAAVLIENEATLKRFYRYGDTVLLRAENPDFPDLEYKDSQLEGIRILGKATHFISRIR